jgi:hypothetical protein
MSKLTIHWQLRDENPAVAHFFLYREGDEVHSDHRHFTRDELERRVEVLRASSGVVPAYYSEALEALEDPKAPRAGKVPIEPGD